MARVLGKVAGRVVNKYNDLTQDSAGVFTSPLNKLWRAKILLDRVTSPFPKDSASKVNVPNPSTSNTIGNPGSHLPQTNQTKRQARIHSWTGYGTSDINSESMDPGKYSASQQEKRENVKDVMGIRNANSNKVRIYNMEVSPYQYIELQNRPTSVDFRGETSWAVIKSMGRNTPMYHYTGSEDIIQFNISWFCNDPDPEKGYTEVVTKCRLLESWTKSNSYQAAPPILKIQWGNSQHPGGSLFEGHRYILSSATYTLKDFHNIARTFNRKGLREEGGLYDQGLMPFSATQELIFKRVSSYNLGWADIVNQELLSKTQGIGYEKK